MGKALQLTGGMEVEEMAKFALMFDLFFDILNVTNFVNAKRHRKPFTYPFCNKDDKRLKVIVPILYLHKII